MTEIEEVDDTTRETIGETTVEIAAIRIAVGERGAGTLRIGIDATKTGVVIAESRRREVDTTIATGDTTIATIIETVKATGAVIIAADRRAGAETAGTVEEIEIDATIAEIVGIEETIAPRGEADHLGGSEALREDVPRRPMADETIELVGRKTGIMDVAETILPTIADGNGVSTVTMIEDAEIIPPTIENAIAMSCTK